MLAAPRAVDGGVSFVVEVVACAGGVTDASRTGTVSLSVDGGGYPVQLVPVAPQAWVGGRAIFPSVVTTGLGLDVALIAQDAQASGSAALDVRRGRPADRRRLLVDQGAYDGITGPGPTAASRAALFWAQADVVALSHLINGATIDPACGTSSANTVATAQAALPLLRRLSDTRVFLYVPATVDAPVGHQCGNAQTSTGVSLTNGDWLCPGGMCSKFIAWVNQLEAFQPDGYFLDYFSLPPSGLAAPTTGYKVGLTTARNLVSYVAALNRGIMVNTLYSSQANVEAILPAFDAWPTTLPAPRLLFEGWYVRDGALDAVTLQGSDVVGGSATLRARFARDFLSTESQMSGSPFACSFQNGATAYGLFGQTRVAGDTFQYSRSSLYVGASRTDPYCLF